MKKTTLKGKGILAVNDETNILVFLAEESEHHGVILDLARSGDTGCLDLLTLAVGKDIPVVMLTADTMNPEALHQSIELGARAFLPKQQIVQIMPFLEDVFTLNSRSWCRKNFGKIAGYCGKTYGQGWCQSESNFLKSSGQDLGSENFVIILE